LGGLNITLAELQKCRSVKKKLKEVVVKVVKWVSIVQKSGQKTMIGCHTKNLIFGVCAVIGLNATCVVMNYASLQPHPSMVAYNDHVCYPTGY